MGDQRNHDGSVPEMRFTPTAHGYMGLDANGDWVEYSEYVALRSRLSEALKENEGVKDECLRAITLVNGIHAATEEAWRKAESENAKLSARVGQLDRALQSLTPGGSEYVNDPIACVAYVRKVRDSQHETILKFKQEAKEAQARVGELEKASEERRLLLVRWIEVVRKYAPDVVAQAEREVSAL